MKRLILFSLSLICLASCNFYLGMFKRNDLLVAQDHLYKEKTPYRLQYAKYGRVFKCPITYLRVVDRLGYGRGPKTKIIRGGLRKKYVVLRIAAYNSPISVNIYVGCANEQKATTRTKKITTKVAKTTTAKSTGTPNSAGTPNAAGTKTSAEATTAVEASNAVQATTLVEAKAAVEATTLVEAKAAVEATTVVDAKAAEATTKSVEETTVKTD